MGKIVRVIVGWLFAWSVLYAAPLHYDQLKQFDKSFQTARSDEVLKLHHMLKNIYIQSIIENDKSLKIKALKRLIQTSTTLKLSSESYKKELATLENIAPNSIKKPTVPKIPMTQTPVAPMVAPTEIAQKPIIKASQKTLTVLKVMETTDGIRLGMNRDVDLDEIKAFTLKSKGVYRYVFDLKGTLMGRARAYREKNIDLKRVSQYNNRVVRVVFSHNKPLKLESTVKGKYLSITLVPDKKELAKQPLSILRVSKVTGGVKLRMNREIHSSEIKDFTLKSEGAYRYVFDFKGKLMGNARTYKDSDIDLVRVAQYNKAIARVVLSHKRRLDVDAIVDGRTVIIGLSDDLAVIPKRTTTKTTSKPALFSNGFDPKSQVIVIDAGHGGKDAGAIGYKRYREKKVVLQIAKKLGSELKKRGYKIYYTRTTDKFIKLRDRTKIANDKKADLFLSIHANAAPKKSKYMSMKGLETFFLSPARSERSKNVAALENKSDIDEMDYFSKQTFLNFLNREKIIASNKMALDVQQGMLSSLHQKYKVKDGGVREAPFWVLVGAQMPSILIEVGYITNPTDAKNMVNTHFQNLLVKGIAGGIDSYFYKNY